MKYFEVTPLPETKFKGITIYPEDEQEERFLKAKIHDIKEIEKIRNFLRRPKTIINKG